MDVPGVSVAVIHDFGIHWAKGYGVRDVTTGLPVDTATLFQAASISKPVAAMASLRAVQDGLFGLDDDIDDILTSWSLDGGDFVSDRPVTPRTLMSHTSGLGDAFGFPGYDPSDRLPAPVQILSGAFPSNTRPLFMERAPMEAFEYSGGGVTLQQLALSDAGGRPFADILRDDVLEPLGMTRSSFEQPMPVDREENAARAHDGEGAPKGEARWHLYPEQAAAGLWTTPSDLARFAIEVQRAVRGESSRVLDRAHAREMITPVGVGSYAVGFGLSKRGEGWYFQHGGSNWGFRGTLIAHTVKGYGLVILTNGDRGGEVLREIQARIERAYDWDVRAGPVPRGYRPAADRAVVDLPAEALGRFEGSYERASDAPVEIALVGGRLRFHAEGEDPYPMVAHSPTEFRLDGANVELVFEIDEGLAVGFTLLTGGVQRHWRRVDRTSSR